MNAHKMFEAALKAKAGIDWKAIMQASEPHESVFSTERVQVLEWGDLDMLVGEDESEDAYVVWRVQKPGDESSVAIVVYDGNTGATSIVQEPKIWYKPVMQKVKELLSTAEDKDMYEGAAETDQVFRDSVFAVLEWLKQELKRIESLKETPELAQRYEKIDAAERDLEYWVSLRTAPAELTQKVQQLVQDYLPNTKHTADVEEMPAMSPETPALDTDIDAAVGGEKKYCYKCDSCGKNFETYECLPRPMARICEPCEDSAPNQSGNDFYDASTRTAHFKLKSYKKEAANEYYRPEVDEIGKFWVVTNANSSSELLDVCFETNLGGLMRQALGGLDAIQIQGVYAYDNEDEALLHAQRLIDEAITANENGPSSEV